MVQASLEGRIKILEKENESLAKTLKETKNSANNLEEKLSEMNKKNNVLKFLFRIYIVF
jgi:hypothetical protein